MSFKVVSCETQVANCLGAVKAVETKLVVWKRCCFRQTKLRPWRRGFERSIGRCPRLPWTELGDCSAAQKQKHQDTLQLLSHCSGHALRHIVQNCPVVTMWKNFRAMGKRIETGYTTILARRNVDFAPVQQMWAIVNNDLTPTLKRAKEDTATSTE